MWREMTSGSVSGRGGEGRLVTSGGGEGIGERGLVGTHVWGLWLVGSIRGGFAGEIFDDELWKF